MSCTRSRQKPARGRAQGNPGVPILLRALSRIQRIDGRCWQQDSNRTGHSADADARGIDVVVRAQHPARTRADPDCHHRRARSRSMCPAKSAARIFCIALRIRASVWTPTRQTGYSNPCVACMASTAPIAATASALRWCDRSSRRTAARPGWIPVPGTAPASVSHCRGNGTIESPAADAGAREAD